MVDINTTGIRSALRGIDRAVNSTLDASVDAIGEAVVDELSTSNLINRRSGLMARSWGYRRRGRRQVVPTNSARSPQGFPYPVVVEARFGGVERTLRTRRRNIARQAQRNLARNLARSGTRGGRR